MADLLISEIEPAFMDRLRDRASTHGRTPETEAKLILQEALASQRAEAWAGAQTIFDQLAGSGRTFSDSAELVREDRER